MFDCFSGCFMVVLKLFSGCFFRLLATHYPHLCLVEDWLDEELASHDLPEAVIRVSGFTCTVEKLGQGLFYKQDQCDIFYDTSSFLKAYIDNLILRSF